MGGYGAYFGDACDFSEPLPTNDHQTNERTKLRALLGVLQVVSSITPTKHWALALDSTYFIKGANAGAAKWKEKVWVGLAGKMVAHVEL